VSDAWGIGWLLILLLVNAFFVAAEFSIISARRSQIEPRADKGSRSAKTALWAMEHATLMLATTQLGITVCSLLILNVSEPAIHDLVSRPLDLVHLSVAVVETISFLVALLIVSIPERAVLILAPPLVGFATIFRPIIVALNATSNGIVRLFGIKPKSEANTAYTVDEVANIVAQSTREGLLTDTTGTLNAAFEFSTKHVADLAVGMAQLVTLPEDAAPADVERAVAQRGFSRYVLVDDRGEPTGYLHLKDVLDLDDTEYDEPVPPRRIRKLISIAGATDIEDALATMRRTGLHVARVFGDTGLTLGALFLEDIIEELVGEVQDATRRRL
jgi:CBS domain containing-hemolysin-like protein